MKTWYRRAAAMVAATTTAVVVTGWPTDSRIFDSSRAGRGTELGTATFDALGETPKLPPSGQVAIVTPTSAPVAEVAVAPPPAQFNGPAARPVPPPAVLRQQSAGAQKAGGTWAVVVGVNDYPGTNADLKSAVNDANDVVEALGGFGVGGDRILALRDGQATAANIRAAMGWLTSRAGPDSVGVFFFAGHVRKGGPGGEALVAADGNDIDDVEVAKALDRLESREAWIGIAACYGGGFVEVMKPGRVLTGAASANEVAYENSGFGRSYMVEFMVRQAMIQNRAPETVQSAFYWAREQIRKDYPDRLPVQFDHSDGKLDLRQGGQAAKPPPPPPKSGGNPPSGAPSPPPSTTPPRDETCTETLTVTWCSS